MEIVLMMENYSRWVKKEFEEKLDFIRDGWESLTKSEKAEFNDLYKKYKNELS